MTTYQPTESGLSFLLKTLGQYQKPSYFLVAAAMLLVVAAIFEGRKVRCAFVWPLLILAVTVFNPYIFPFLFVEQGRLVEKYYMFLWTVPVTLIIGCGIISCIRHIPVKWLRPVVFAGALAAIAFFGTPKLISYVDVVLPSDLMKADPELVTICGYLSGHADTVSPLVAFERRDFAEEAMELDASIRISGMLEGKKPSEIEAEEVDFAVIGANSEDVAKRLAELGMVRIAHTPDSYVFAPKQ